MAKSDFILGRTANREAFENGHPFVASAYRRATNWSLMFKLREAGHNSARALRYSYIGSVRFADGMAETRNTAPWDKPSVGYRIRIKPKSSM